MEKPNEVQERLDRSFVFKSWMAKFFHGSSYDAFAPVSDHLPIVSQTEEQATFNSFRNFMLENKWLREHGLWDVITSS